MDRRSVVVELQAPRPTFAADATRAQKAASLRRAAEAAKDAAAPLLRRLRLIDPGMSVNEVRDTIFPTLTIVTTERALRELNRSDLVRVIEDTYEFQGV